MLCVHIFVVVILVLIMVVLVAVLGEAILVKSSLLFDSMKSLEEGLTAVMMIKIICRVQVAGKSLCGPSHKR